MDLSRGPERPRSGLGTFWVGSGGHTPLALLTAHPTTRSSQPGGGGPVYEHCGVLSLGRVLLTSKSGSKEGTGAKPAAFVQSA